MSTEITVVNDIVEINVSEEVIVIEAPSGAYPLPTGVYSVYGRTGNVVAQEGDYTLTQLGGVTITNPLSGQALVYNGTSWVNNTETYTGTVTSVNMSVPTGLTISGNPITTAGTLALGLASGYSIPTTANQANWTTAYNDSIVSAAVTGVQTKTLTLNQQDGGTITASWSDYDTAPVTSVFGRTGAITAQSGDYNTLQVTENTNLYFTNQRARFAISGDATSGVVYSNTTGIIALDDIPNTSLLNDSVTINGSTVALGGSTSFTTSAVAEGTNLYYTQARFNSAFAAKSTTDLAEGTNLYFTTARAQSAITGTSPISVTSGNVSITQASGSTNGYLSSDDWTAFNAKQAALTFSSPLVNTSGTISIPAATSSANGYLTSTDWTTFNSKQAALSGTGFVKINGTTISYDNSTYLTTIEGITAGGELSGTYASPSLVNNAVTGKVLTGVNITGGSISASDSILTAFGKVQNQINGLVGGSIYQGTWNASTNTPALASGVGTKGYYYIVSVAGTTNLDGITDWNVGDWAIYDGTAWQQVDNTDAVVSVNGFTGAVSLTTSNISEGTNLYYTDARARGSVSAGTGISYNSTSGVITNSAPDQTVSLTGAGTTSISGTYPNFTVTSNDQYVGTVTSVGLTSTAAALTITNSPITTSGNIGVNFSGNSGQYVAGDGSLVPFPTVVTQAQNLVTEVYNNSGATITKGTVVYINGGQGNLPTITKAQANTEVASNQTIGLVRADITNMNNGYVTVAGTLIDLNTNGFSTGTTLYLSPTTAGAYTSTKPTAPDHIVYVGIVVRAHPTQGVIEVKIQNTQELNESADVLITSPTGGQILQYNGTTSLWNNVAGTTSSIAEGTNLYYTDARARGAISLTTTGNNGASTYNSTTGVLNVPTYTLAGLGGINLTSLSATSPLLYNNTTGVFSIQQSSGSQAGFLSAADWTTFNSKQNALTNPVTGTGTTNYLPKFTGASTIGNSQIQDDGTSVGIGGSPNASYKLAVTGNTLGTGTAFDFFTSSGIGSSGVTGLLRVVTAGTSSAIAIGQANSSRYTAIQANEYITYNDDMSFRTFGSFPLTLGTNNTTRLTISSAGNVGIGTSSPFTIADTNLTVNGTTSSAIQLGFNGTRYGQFYTDSGEVRLSAVANLPLTFYSNNLERMRITSGGQIGIGITPTGSWGLQMYGNGTASSVARIQLQNSSTGSADGDGGGISMEGIDFVTRNNESGVVKWELGGTERMRITSSGKVMVNTTDIGVNAYLYASANSNQPYPIGSKGLDSVQGLIGFFDQANNNIGSIFRQNSSTQYNTSSDYRLKEDFKEVNGLDKVLSIKVYDFKWKGYDFRSDGVIAHELQEILPYAVSGQKDDVNKDGSIKAQGVDYSKLTPILIKAIQELSAKVTALENKG